MSAPISNNVQPLELPRLVMRRAAWAAVGALLAALLLGLWRSGSDIDEETRGALALTATLARLVDAAQRDDAQAAAAIAPLLAAGGLRHVALTLRDAQSRVVFDSAADDGVSGTSAWFAWLDRPWRAGTAPAREAIALPRPDGSAWTLQVAAARDSERREAMSDLLETLVLVAAGSIAMLAIMAWNMRRAFAPLRTLVHAIEQLRGGNAPDAGHLAKNMPIRELQSIAQAVHGLQGALDEEAARRRVLSRQVMTLQEDERQRLARELHDEFGQHLTALRADATWLAGRMADAPAHAGVAQGMAERCGELQLQIRGLLSRLRPLSDGDAAATEPASRLAELLRDLVQGWARSTTQACVFELRLALRSDDAGEQPWPAGDDAPRLPRKLVLAIYRMSQEALTNVARHSRAKHALLVLTLHVDGRGAHAVDWTLSDDGVGLPEPQRAMQRGTGLAGLKERAWVEGAELRIEPAAGPRECPGLRLAARFDLAAAT